MAFAILYTRAQCTIDAPLVSVEVHVSKCPDGHGMIKSPMCCGQDMTCSV